VVWTTRWTAASTPRSTAAARRCRGHRVADHRAEPELGGLAEVLGLLALLTRHGDDDVVTVEDDLGAADTDAVDTVLDDLAGLVEGVPVRLTAVHGACGQRDPRTTLKVDAELRFGLVIARAEHQAIEQNHDEEEEREVAPWADLPGG
jgi:hypothetical protein